MYKKFIFYFSLSISIMNTTCHKPPLPQGALHPEFLPVDQIPNNDLRARPFTVIDKFNQRFENQALNSNQKRVLDLLNQRHKVIIDHTKEKYLGLIAAAKEEKFNRSEKVCKLIDKYERKLLNSVVNDPRITDLINQFITALDNNTVDYNNYHSLPNYSSQNR